MRSRRSRRGAPACPFPVWAAAVALCGAALALAAPAGGGAVFTITLPSGSEGIGFDDLGFSRALGRILVPAGSTGNLDLVDPESLAVTVIGGLSAAGKYAGAHGEGVTSVDDGGGVVFVTDRTDRKLIVVDPMSKTIAATAGLASDPDYVRYVGPTREVWVTEPEAEQIEIFPLASNGRDVARHDAFIKVAGGPESLVIDAGRGRAYANQWTDTTLAIDLKSRTIVARWKNGCAGSRGLALDEARAFLFVGCKEGKAVTLDAAHDGRVLGSAEAGAGVDIIAYSPKLAHLYLPGAKSAGLAILDVSSAGRLTLLGSVPTVPGAHCVAADDRGAAYVCDPQGGRLLLIRDPFPLRAATKPRRR